MIAFPDEWTRRAPFIEHISCGVKSQVFLKLFAIANIDSLVHYFIGNKLAIKGRPGQYISIILLS